MPRCLLWLVTAVAVTEVTQVSSLGQGDSGHEDGNALVRRHELEASQSLSQQSLHEASVDFAGKVHTLKHSRDQDRRALAAASPAVASSSDPRDADDVAAAPSPSRLVFASSVTSPPSADTADTSAVSAFPQTGNAGTVPPTDQSTVKNAPLSKVHHPVQHRLTMTTLALCMLSSGILGLLVVWRQGKVLLNKPRRGEDEPDDFQKQVARVLRKRSSQASVRSKDSKGARERSERSERSGRTSQASSSSAPVVQQVQVESNLEVPEVPEVPESPVASAMAAPAPALFAERDAEADAAGGGMRKNQPKN